MDSIVTGSGSILLFLHLLGGAFWLGASMFANVAVVPYIGARPAAERGELVQRLILGPERLLIGAALLAGSTGLLLGVTSGRIGGFDDLSSPFGTLWIASIVTAIAVFATGGLVTSRAAVQLATRPHADDAPSSRAGAETAFRRLRLGFAVEVTGIVSILALMVALGRS
ncbi:MAG: hypothetical protein ABIW50_01385 [Candidatus Limnocylindria bacterium]